ncbi:MAG: hypothetical protein MJZ16_10435 [Bacteroidales bacterium]|nr:hypothetical protein [Bacteroidales bacterium]
MDYLSENGFTEDDDSMCGYVDFHKEVTEDKLVEMLPAGYDSFELDEVINMHGGYARIVVSALEMDAIDDDGDIAPRGLQIYGTLVHITGNGAFSDVVFMEGNRSFIIPLMSLRIQFRAITMFQVMESLRAFQNGHPWTFDELKDYFKDVITDYKED